MKAFEHIAVELACDDCGGVPEGPLWSEAEQCVYWPDITQRCIRRLEPSTGAVTKRQLDFEFSAIAQMQNNALLVLGNNALYRYDFANDQLELVNANAGVGQENRLNDAKVDSCGRFWAGSLRVGLAEPSGNIYSINENARLARQDQGYTAANGLGWSPSFEHFYMIETVSQILYRYDFNVDEGKISHKTAFIDFNEYTGKPDGMCVDGEGNLWVAMWDGGCVMCFSASGHYLGQINVPVPKVTCVTFGGANYDTLYISTASYGLSEDEASQYPWAGALLACKPGVIGQRSHAYLASEQVQNGKLIEACV